MEAKTYSYGPHPEQRVRVTLPPRGMKQVRKSVTVPKSE